MGQPFSNSFEAQVDSVLGVEPELLDEALNDFIQRDILMPSPTIAAFVANSR
jgi:hypothetical protein